MATPKNYQKLNTYLNTAACKSLLSFHKVKLYFRRLVCYFYIFQNLNLLFIYKIIFYLAIPRITHQYTKKL